MGTAMFVYQTATRGRSVTLLNEHAQVDFRYCSPVADRTRSWLSLTNAIKARLNGYYSCRCDVKVLLTEGHLGSAFGTLANSADPDQTPENAASDKGLHCLLKL